MAVKETETSEPNLGLRAAVLAIMFIVGGAFIMIMMLPVDSSTFYGVQDFKITDKYYTDKGEYYVDMVTVDMRCVSTATDIFGYGAVKMKGYPLSKETWETTVRGNHIALNYECKNGKVRIIEPGW